MPDGLPRRPRPDGSQRVRNQLETSPGLAAGRSKSLRPVPARPVVSQGDTSNPGGPTASASFRDPNSSFAYGFGDPSSQFQAFGEDGNYFAYDSGSQGIALLRAGWYQIAVDGFINGGTAGEVVRVLGFWTTPFTVEGIDIIDGSGQAHPNCVSLPFYDDGTGTVIQIQVLNQSGSSGTQANPTIHLVAFG